MNVKVKMDVKPLGNSFNALKSKWPKEMDQITYSETGAIIRNVMRNTKSITVPLSKEQGLRRGYNKFRNGEDKVSIGKNKNKGVVWFSFKNKDGKREFKPVGKWDGSTALPANSGMKPGQVGDELMARYRDTWNGAQPLAKSQEKASKGARGTTQRSWSDILGKIPGQDTSKVPGYILNSKRRDNKQSVSSAFTKKENGNMQVQIVNMSGSAIKTGGRSKLASAIRSRSLFWSRAIQKGWTENKKWLSKQFPFIK